MKLLQQFGLQLVYRIDPHTGASTSIVPFIYKCGMTLADALVGFVTLLAKLFSYFQFCDKLQGFCLQLEICICLFYFQFLNPDIAINNIMPFGL